MEQEIIISARLEKRLFNLVSVLIEKEYFGILEDAEKYVDDIYDFIQKIPEKKHRKCFSALYGSYFVRYDCPKSKMQYFITFFKKGKKYLMENIISPKTPEYWIIFGQ